MPLQNAWHGQQKQKSQEIMAVLKPHPWPEATSYSSSKLWTPWELRIPATQRGRSQTHHYIMQQLLPLWDLNGTWRLVLQCRGSCLGVPTEFFVWWELGDLAHTNTWCHKSADLWWLRQDFHILSELLSLSLVPVQHLPHVGCKQSHIVSSGSPLWGLSAGLPNK